jgi:hypothetical protein
VRREEEGEEEEEEEESDIRGKKYGNFEKSFRGIFIDKRGK